MTVESAIRQEVDAHITMLDEQFRHRMKTLEDEFRGDLEKRVKDATNRLFWSAAAIVCAIFAAATLAVYGSLKEVNTQVITLQTGIISAQTTIQNSNKELTDQTGKLATANAAMAEASKALEGKTHEINSAMSIIRAPTKR